MHNFSSVLDTKKKRFMYPVPITLCSTGQKLLCIRERLPERQSTLAKEDV